MSKGISSYPEHLRESVARRRIAGNVKGLGFWGATDYFNRKKVKKVVKKEASKESVK